METTREERIEALEEALEALETAREALADEFARDEYFRRTVGADLEGREYGWLGEGLMDRVRVKLEAVRSNEDEGE